MASAILNMIDILHVGLPDYAKNVQAISTNSVELWTSL